MGKEKSKKRENAKKEKNAKAKEKKDKAIKKERDSKYQEKKSKELKAKERTSKEKKAKKKERKAKETGAKEKKAKEKKSKEKKAKATTKEKAAKAKATGPTFNFNTGSPCKGGKGSFVRKLKLNARVDVGIIPAGMNNVWVKLRTDKDVETELWTVKNKKQREIAIVAWRVGKINSPTSASMKYK